MVISVTELYKCDFMKGRSLRNLVEKSQLYKFYTVGADISDRVMNFSVPELYNSVILLKGRSLRIPAQKKSTT